MVRRRQVVAATLRGIIAAVEEAGAFPLVHCCAPNPPIALMHSAGARALSLDLGQLSTAAFESIGETVEGGAGLFAGLVPATEPAGGAAGPVSGGARDEGLSGVGDTVSFLRQVWRRLGFPPEQLARTAVVTPTCGLAGASPSYVRTALARCREVARAAYETPEG